VAAPSYLVVYLARPELPGRHWWQPTNDPELRGGDMTWGICRPNVRGIRNIVGANLFFVACDPQRLLSDRYHLPPIFTWAKRSATLLCITGENEQPFRSMANGNFGRSRTPISDEADQGCRLMPNTHFG
jgi:hypothetical protein